MKRKKHQVFDLTPVARIVNGLAPIQKQTDKERQIDMQWRDLYEKRVNSHEKELNREAESNIEKLRSPEASRMIGVDGELPEFTRRVLGRSIAADKIGPQRPKADKYESTGSSPTILHKFN